LGKEGEEQRQNFLHIAAVGGGVSMRVEGVRVFDNQGVRDRRGEARRGFAKPFFERHFGR
jgi:hypothetical protein